MKAMVVHAHGGPEVMEFIPDFPDPVIGDGDVLVRVRASSLNYHDVFTRRGMPGIKIPMPLIMGLDVAGEIVEIGPGVVDWFAARTSVSNPAFATRFARAAGARMAAPMANIAMVLNMTNPI